MVDFTMRTIHADMQHEIVVQKSRFICVLNRVDSEEDARETIAARRKAHFDASHHCSAYVLGERGEIMRSSDDGEPAGTAGVPMLEVLKHREMTNLVAVVTRYFGGTKLGAGGLVRAYGASVSAALDVAEIVSRHELTKITLSCDYTVVGALEAALRAGPCQFLDVRYGESVGLDVAVDPANMDEFESWLLQRHGSVRYEQVGSIIVER